jgi:pimeloyl-ACP methyl ester carboxylesterase
MSTFVLVHGAWSGAHGFRHVRKILQSQGHEVFTPSLTGLGERVHLSHAMVNLTTHVRDVVNHVLYEDLQDIVLLGFSYGGMVVTGAIEHLSDRIRHLVYLDAFVPSNGESVASSIHGGPVRPPVIVGGDWLVQSAPRQFDDPLEGQWVTARRTPQPGACFSEPVYLARPLEEYPFTRTYIKATAKVEGEPAGDVFWKAARHAQSSSSWRYFEIDTNHMVASNRPKELARLLLDLGRDSG